MKDVLIQFNELEWKVQGKGVRTKEYLKGNQKIRIIEFSEGFVEEDWCTKGHIGYVLEGAMRIDFNGRIISYEKGDGLWIEQGEEQKHKVLIQAGESVQLLLFE